MIARKLPRLYFGPVTRQPSWKWVGEDIAKYIATSYNVSYFEGIEEIEEFSIVYWIKRPPRDDEAHRIRDKRLTLIFFPVDSFQNTEEISAHRNFIMSASCVCLHAHSLASFFPGTRISFVEHYNKFGIPPTERNSDKTTLLWIGGFQYVPYVLYQLDKIKWPRENITILTDHDHLPARIAAAANANAIGFGDYLEKLEKSRINLMRWSEPNQKFALQSCAAAFDIKHLSCFNQFHKPPTKLQKYVASFIPCAANEGFLGAQQIGNIAHLEELEDLKAYSPYEQSRRYELAVQLQKETTLQSVANSYLNIAFTALESDCVNMDLCY